MMKTLTQNLVGRVHNRNRRVVLWDCPMLGFTMWAEDPREYNDLITHGVAPPHVTLELPDRFVNHRVLVTVQTLDEGDGSHPAPLTADESDQLLAWGHQSLAQVDARIEERRRADWEED